jgi:SAM-dependent methyltransferase
MLARCLADLDAGAEFKPSFERLLLELPDAAAEETMLLVKESRGAWLALLEASGGEALFLGNPLSGTVIALAQAGFRVTLADRDEESLRFAAHHVGAHGAGRAVPVVLVERERLPFADASFDLVVREEGIARGASAAERSLVELARVTRGELVVCADNRLGYKRSAGRRGRFDVPGPLAYLRQVLRPTRGERSLAGYRAALAAHFPRARDFALYPHAREFSHVVALGSARPRLTIGPKERKNLPKLAASALGLFPLLAPSFAIVGSRRPSTETRIERVLRELARILDEPRPELDILVATRSDTCLAHTRVPGRSEDDPLGRWTLHVPLSPQKRHLTAKHHGFLCTVRERFASVPVPEPLHVGEIDGLWLTCERRLGGLTAPHRSGDRGVIGRMFRDVAEHFASLVLGPPVSFTQELFDELVRPRFEIVARHAAVASTIASLEAMLPRVAELLVGQRFPLVLYHADLRSKHVQVGPDGAVLGYLDWGASEKRFLPYVDLLHLVAHERKQEERSTAARSWELVRERKELREHERCALDVYAQRLGIADPVRRALELAYPVLVTAMAELNWAFSRPRWLHRQFGV